MTEAEKLAVCCIGDIRKLDLPDETPVQIHVGWDWGIGEIDVDKEGLVLFPAIPEDMWLVDRKWVHHHPHAKECCGDD